MQTPSAKSAAIDQSLVALAQAMAPDLQIVETAKPGREYIVTVLFQDQTTVEVTQRFPDFGAALDFGMDLRKEAQDRVEVRPAIQMTEGEGRARYPLPLHRDAFVAAWTAWYAESQREQVAITRQNNYLRATGELRA